MKKDVPFVRVGTNVKKAFEMTDPLFPVAILIDEDENFLGIIDFNKISRKSSKEDVSKYAICTDYYVYLDDHIEHAAILLEESRESFLPVFDEKTNKVVGIISVFDMLDALVHLTAFEEKGVELIFSLKDVPGQLKRIVDLMYENDINILSVLTYRKAGEDQRKLFIKVNAIDVKRIKKVFENSNLSLESVSFEEGLWG
jgi:CBS domain-containing protein